MNSSPRFAALLEKASPELLERLIGLGKTIDDRAYAPWAELAYRAAPEGLRPEEYWLALQIKRAANRIDLTQLTAKSGRPMQLNLTPRMHTLLRRIERAMPQGVDPNLRDTPTDAPSRYRVSALMEEAIHSSLFEGAVSTVDAAKDMLRSQARPLDLSKQMIVNNYRAMQQIVAWRDLPLSVNRLLDLQRILTENTLDQHAVGRFQTAEDVRVMLVSKTRSKPVFEPPHAHEIAQRIAALIEFANAPDDEEELIPPIVRAILVHYGLAYIHPFQDGNGRTARALFYWVMLARGYRIAEYLAISRQILAQPKQYLESFEHAQADEDDVTYFVLHQLTLIDASVGDLHRYLERKREELKALDGFTRFSARFNARQRAAVSYAVRHPGATFTAISHQTSHQISNNTAKADLKELSDWALLERKRVGTKDLYQVPLNFIQRLKRFKG